MGTLDRSCGAGNSVTIPLSMAEPLQASAEGQHKAEIIAADLLVVGTTMCSALAESLTS